MGDFRASQARTVASKRQRKPNVRLGDIGEWQVMRQRKKPRRNDSNATRMETAAAKAVEEADHGLAPEEIDLAKSLSTFPFGEFHGKLKDYDKLGDVQDDGGVVDASKSQGSHVISRNRVRKGKQGRARLAVFSMVDALVAAAASSAEENANQAGGVTEEDNVSDDTKEIAAMLMDTDSASAAEEGCLALAMAGSMQSEKDRSSADVSDFEDEKNLMQDFAAAAAAAGNSNATDEEAPPLPAEKEKPETLASLKNGVHGWLHELKLDRYADLFELHEVDPDVVPMLTMEDLEEMGIVAVGPRRKIFHEIQQLRKRRSLRKH